MKRIVFIVVFFLVIINLSAQWSWQNPKPQGNQLLAIKFATEDTGWIAGVNGLIYRTTDAGITWEQQADMSGEMIRSLCFVSSRIGWAVGRNSTILHTENGGENWEQQVCANGTDFLSAFFLNVDTGWICGIGGKIFKTENGGNSWIQQSTGIDDQIQSIYFINDSLGYACAEDLLKTTDGGITWISKPSPSSFKDIYFISDSVGWGAGSSIYKTTDGGNNWQALTVYGEVSSFNSITFSPNGRGWAVGEYHPYNDPDGGKIFKGSVAYSNWNEVYFPENCFIYSIEVLNSGKVFASGDGGLITFSSDNGSTWNDNGVAHGILLRSVKFTSESRGWSVGDQGTMLRTINGGEEWELRNPVTEENLRDIDFVSENTGWIVGYHSTILKTENAGDSWQDISLTGFNTNFLAVDFISDSTGWTVGQNKKILKTTDGGASWIEQQHTSLGEYFLDVFFYDEFTGWVTGNNGAILRTTNGGETWENQTSGTAYELDAVCFVSPDKGWIAGGYYVMNGFILSTSDGGQSWQQDYTSSAHFLSLDFLTERKGYICGYEGTVMITTNGGISWSANEKITKNRLTSIQFLNDELGWACGEYGSIINTAHGGLPVELTSFEYKQSGAALILNWETASEVNNFGFEVERKPSKENKNNKAGWSKLGFIQGAGTTTLPQSYQFRDENILPGKYLYRLKQIDLDGKYEYSDEIEAIVELPLIFSLEQNFPNPFNPATKIKYSIPAGQKVELKIFDLLGREITTLVNEYKSAGHYETEFNGEYLSSGIYLYRLTAGDYSETKKMLLLK